MVDAATRLMDCCWVGGSFRETPRTADTATQERAKRPGRGREGRERAGKMAPRGGTGELASKQAQRGRYEFIKQRRVERNDRDRANEGGESPLPGRLPFPGRIADSPVVRCRGGISLFILYSTKTITHARKS